MRRENWLDGAEDDVRDDLMELVHCDDKNRRKPDFEWLLFFKMFAFYIVISMFIIFLAFGFEGAL